MKTKQKYRAPARKTSGDDADAHLAAPTPRPATPPVVAQAPKADKPARKKVAKPHTTATVAASSTVLAAHPASKSKPDVLNDAVYTVLHAATRGAETPRPLASTSQRIDPGAAATPGEPRTATAPVTPVASPDDVVAVALGQDRAQRSGHAEPAAASIATKAGGPLSQSEPVAKLPGPEMSASTDKALPASPAKHEAIPVAEPDSPEAMPDFEALAENMGRLVEQGGRAASALLATQEGQPKSSPFSQDVADAFQTLGKVAEHWLAEPGRMMQAQSAFTTKFMDLWASSLQRFTAEPAAAAQPTAAEKTMDKRFSDPEWRENPVFDFLRRAYLLGTTWANDLVEGAESLDETTRARARFHLRQISSALSPSNFVVTNPEVLRETIKQNGGNLVRGMTMLVEDIAAGHGDLKIRQTDSSKFKLGVNMALTPGKVVFRNDLMELLQYAPSTETVYKRPLLIVPPWINKFYVLDLNPEKSFIRWAVAQGLTVFVVSWVNPDQRHADKGFEAYMREGILTALDVIETATGEADVSTIGYCVGGTLLAVTLAYMAATGDARISSTTLFTTQVDFSHAGDLKQFAHEAQIKAVEAEMRDAGYLKGTKMAQAFNMLRPEDLIWSYVVNNYLKGKDPQPFDLLAWNADSTRMPAANHSFYLRNCYLENKLTRGLMEIGGQRLDLGRVTIPVYNLAAREDHIAPALSVFEGSRAFGGPVRYVMAGSGHIAGVVSPPGKAKHGFWLGPDPKGSFADWLAAAVHHPASWWPNWKDWLVAQAPERVPARDPGGGGLLLLDDAPGTYVRMKS